MKVRFKKDFFFPSYCKELWIKYSNNYNWGKMDIAEFNEVYKNYKIGLTSHRRHIWRLMSKLFKSRPINSLKHRFFEVIRQLLRQVVCIYAFDENKAFCIYYDC